MLAAHVAASIFTGGRWRPSPRLSARRAGKTVGPAASEVRRERSEPDWQGDQREHPPFSSHENTAGSRCGNSGPSEGRSS